LSGLTKKTVYADKLLATLLGVREGDHVSYADLSRGLHKYIKDNNLKNRQAPAMWAAPTSSVELASSATPAVVAVTTVKKCVYCDAEIPSAADFCDMCGAKQ
jgi:hypothetical protein